MPKTHTQTKILPKFWFQTGSRWRGTFSASWRKLTISQNNTPSPVRAGNVLPESRFLWHSFLFFAIAFFFFSKALITIYAAKPGTLAPSSRLISQTRRASEIGCFVGTNPYLPDGQEWVKKVSFVSGNTWHTATSDFCVSIIKLSFHTADASKPRRLHLSNTLTH